MLPIYFINLASRPDRKEFMERQFRSLELVAERIEAVTPRDIPAADKDRYCDPMLYRWMSPGELACSLSHQRAIAAFLRTNAPFGLVFEDDARLSPVLTRFVKDMETTQPSFDLLRIETYPDYPVRMFPGNAGRIGQIAIRRAAGWATGSAGYVLSRKAARAILDCHDVMRMPMDEVLYNPYRPLTKAINIRAADPALCVQLPRQEGNSDLTAGRGGPRNGERLPVWRRAVYAVRGILDRDVRMGLMKLYYQVTHRARKEVLPFAGGTVSPPLEHDGHYWFRYSVTTQMPVAPLPPAKLVEAFA